MAPTLDAEKPAAPSVRTLNVATPEIERARRSLSRSAAGLVLEPRADHLVRVDLQGRFRSATVATRNAEGQVQRRCIDQPEELDRMLGTTR